MPACLFWGYAYFFALSIFAFALQEIQCANARALRAISAVFSSVLVSEILYGTRLLARNISPRAGLAILEMKKVCARQRACDDIGQNNLHIRRPLAFGHARCVGVNYGIRTALDPDNAVRGYLGAAGPWPRNPAAISAAAAMLSSASRRSSAACSGVITNSFKSMGSADV